MNETRRRRTRVSGREIAVRYVADGTEAVGHVKNVSRAGVFVVTDDLPRAGAVISLQLNAPDGSLVDVRGEVRWTTDGIEMPDAITGFGVLIQEPPPDYLELFAWIRSCAKPEKPADDEPL